MNITEMMVKVSLAGASTWVMWFMVVLSVLSVAVVVERVIFFNRNQGDPEGAERVLREQLAKGTPEDALKALEGRTGLEAATLRAGLSAADRGPTAIEEIMQGAMKVERLRFERGLAFLGTIGNNAPFIGLFGTVVEIIRALHELGEKSGVGANSVMGRLSEALAATAVGLMVALPAVAMFNYFTRRLRVFTVGAEALMHTMKGYLGTDKPEQ